MDGIDQRKQCGEREREREKKKNCSVLKNSSSLFMLFDHKSIKSLP